MTRPGAAALLAVVLALASCADPTAPRDPADAGDAGAWTALPSFPLAPRAAAVTAWTGSEILVLGGDLGPPCLDTGAVADCERAEAARDGAAFEPADATWRETAEAPVPLQGHTPSAVSGDTVYVLVGGQLSDDSQATIEGDVLTVTDVDTRGADSVTLVYRAR